MTNEQTKKFNKLRKQTIDIKIYEYLNNILKNLYIEITGDYEGTTLYLMKRNLLEGWCWQTTESTIIFFNDDDYICRGNLKLDKNTIYYHSWICFKYEHNEYIFDPCLNILCKKKIYDKVFQTSIKSTISAKIVKDDLIYKLLNPTPPKKREISPNTQEFMDRFFKKYIDEKKDEIFITDSGKDDINEPMYRNSTGYTAKIENNKIKALKAHYYQKLY